MIWRTIIWLLLATAAYGQTPSGLLLGVAGHAGAGTETITATTPANLATTSATYTQAGTYANGPPLALDYSFDATTCGSSATSPTISGGTYSWTNTGPGSNGSHTITVCDHASHALRGTSGSFLVGYVGEGDVVSGAAAWYSCATAYSNSFATGSNVGCNLRRVSDSHTCDLLLTTSGTFGLTTSCSTPAENGTVLATWLAATSAVVVTAYDQSGNGRNATEATAGKQPALTLAYANGMPCIHPDGVSTILLGSFVSHAQPNSMTLTAAHLGVFGAGAGFSAYLSGGEVIDYDDSIEGPDAYAGVVLSASASINVNHAIEVVFTTAPNSAVYVDGSATTGDAGTNGTDAGIGIGGNAGGAQFNNMEFCSGGVWTGVAFNGTQAAALKAIQKAAYSTP